MKYIERFILSTLLVITCFTSAQAQTSRGKASYYSDALHGRRMSNGERYNRDSLVCAHRTYPLGTLLRVTNPSNDKSVIVRVADRGPFSHGRIIDLSKAAARELGIIARGVALVQVQKWDENINPYIDEMPEIEYEMAGVAYEFIPQWENGVDTEEEEVKTIPRKTQPAVKPQVHKHTAAKQIRTQGKTTKNYSQKSRQQQVKKGDDSKSWSSFFSKLKDNVTSIFSFDD